MICPEPRGPLVIATASFRLDPVIRSSVPTRAMAKTSRTSRDSSSTVRFNCFRKSLWRFRLSLGLKRRIDFSFDPGLGVSTKSEDTDNPYRELRNVLHRIDNLFGLPRTGAQPSRQRHLVIGKSLQKVRSNRGAGSPFRNNHGSFAAGDLLFVLRYLFIQLSQQNHLW